MRVFAKFFNTDKPSDAQPVSFKCLALFCAPVATAFPTSPD
jgi:hypothetical protein